MNAHRITILFAAKFSLNIAICWAQSAEEMLARDAERAGRPRDALTQCAGAALQKSAKRGTEERRVRSDYQRCATAHTRARDTGRSLALFRMRDCCDQEGQPVLGHP